MPWTTWNQTAWCQAFSDGNAAGVCRALVLLWLAENGRVPEQNAGNIVEVREIMAAPNLGTKGEDKGLRWKGLRTDGMPAPGRHTVSTIGPLLGQLMVPGNYVIGVHSGAQAGGHAIGVLFRQDHTVGFFEPNLGHGEWTPAQGAEFVNHLKTTLAALSRKYYSDDGGPVYLLYQFEPHARASA